MKKNKFVNGIILLSVFGFVSKAIGAVYRIPLTYILTSEGMGLYQMVFPVYALLLSLSSSGFPATISKLISEKIAVNEHKKAQQIFNYSMVLLFAFSFLCTFLVFILSNKIALFQGNPDAGILYKVIAPAIIIVAISSGFKGYFQAKENMLPSSIYMVIEQVGKLIFGLLLASVLLKNGVVYATLGGILGVVISELVALIYLAIHYMLHKKKNTIKIVDEKEKPKRTIKLILSVVLPITLGSILMPISNVIDSTLIINLLSSIGFSTKTSTSLFGLLSGVVGSIINMPVVFSLAITTAILPLVSKHSANKNKIAMSKGVSLSFLFNFLIMLPCAVIMLVFSDLIISFLYGGCLSSSNITIASTLLKFGAITSIYISVSQVSTGALQGMGKIIVPVLSLLIGVIVKTVALVVLVKNPTIHIYGAQIASCLCYSVTAVFNVVILLKSVKLTFKTELIKCVLSNGLFLVACLVIRKLILSFISGKFAVLLILFTALIVLLLIYYIHFREFVKLYLIDRRKVKKQLNNA